MKWAFLRSFEHEGLTEGTANGIILRRCNDAITKRQILAKSKESSHIEIVGYVFGRARKYGGSFMPSNKAVSKRASPESSHG